MHLLVVEVPREGATLAVAATVNGEVDFSFPRVTVALRLLASGPLRPLAGTSAKRATLLPKVPTVAEAALPGVDRSTWHGLIALASVPREITAQRNQRVIMMVATKEMRALPIRQGLDPFRSSVHSRGCLSDR